MIEASDNYKLSLESSWQMNIGVVIVTYNRLSKLKKCLTSYQEQSFTPSIILVVDNASTDGTKEYLDQWESKTTLDSAIKKVIHCDQNLGGAGGFTEGIRHMLDMNVDWIWIADDDAYPDKKCLEIITEYYESLSCEQQSMLAAISAKVVNGDGNISAIHRRKLKRGIFQVKEVPLSEQDYKEQVQKIDLFSFVGTAIQALTIKQVGLPRSDYFIFFDDSEYALRMSKIGQVICLSDALIVHDSPENVISQSSWKNYYMFRNKLYTYKLYFPARYVLSELFKTFFMVLRYYNCPLSRRQLWHALRAIHQEQLGLDTRYLPTAK